MKSRSADQRRFIALAMFVFALVAVAHGLRVVFHWDLVIGTISVAEFVSFLAALLAVAMFLIGAHYLRK